MLVILFLSDTHGGRTHDLRIAEATPYPLPAGSGLLQDLGFLSFTLPEVEMLMPTKKPRSGELTLAQDLANQTLHQRRLRIQPFPAKAYTIENKRFISSGFRKHKVNRINNIRILCRWQQTSFLTNMLKTLELYLRKTNL